MKIYQPSKEETAFLYQQAFELEPLVKDLGSLTVLVEEVEVVDEAASTERSADSDRELNLAPEFAPELQDVNAEVQASPTLGKHQYAVTFVVAPESMQFKVRGVGNSLVEATIAAKTEARRQLNTLMNSLPIELSDKPQWLH